MVDVSNTRFDSVIKCPIRRHLSTYRKYEYKRLFCGQLYIVFIDRIGCSRLFVLEMARICFHRHFSLDVAFFLFLYGQLDNNNIRYLFKK